MSTRTLPKRLAKLYAEPAPHTGPHTLVSIGGSWWQCSCGLTVQASCSCCAPGACPRGGQQ
jgi:hypothetical protein